MSAEYDFDKVGPVNHNDNLGIALRMLLDHHAATVGVRGASLFRNAFHIQTPAEAVRFNCAIGDRSPVLVVVATAPELIKRIEAALGGAL